MSLSVDSRAWTVPSLPGITLLQADLSTHRFPPHSHDHYVIGVSERGLHRAWRRGDEVVLSPDHVSVVAPDEVHAAEAVGDEEWSWRAFHLSPQAVELQFSVARGCQLAALPVREDARIARTLLEAHYALEADGDAGRGGELLRAGLRELFSGARAASRGMVAESETADPRVRRARALIDRRYREPLRLADVARYAAISRYHLVRLFRSEIGLTPYDYLIQQRVQRAQELLASGWSITSVAHEVGFADQSHLHRHFKRRLGVTPGAFRRG